MLYGLYWYLTTSSEELDQIFAGFAANFFKLSTLPIHIIYFSSMFALFFIAHKLLWPQIKIFYRETMDGVEESDDEMEELIANCEYTCRPEGTTSVTIGDKDYLKNVDEIPEDSEGQDSEDNEDDEEEVEDVQRGIRRRR